MSEIKLPKQLLLACESNEPLKIRKFIEQDKCGRYSYWFNSIVDHYGFNLFKKALVEWEHPYFNKYKSDVLNYCMQKACNGNTDAQDFIIDKKIKFTSNSIYYLKEINNLKEKDNRQLDFYDKLKNIAHPSTEIFNHKSDFFDSIVNTFFEQPCPKGHGFLFHRK